MNTYPRSEKLKSEKEISYLFQRGKWVSVGNLRIIFTQHTERNILKDQNNFFDYSLAKFYFKTY